MAEELANQSQSAEQGIQNQAAQAAEQQDNTGAGAEQSASPQAQGQQQEPETFEVKHNKETVKLTREQLLQAASKGLDYERVRPAYDFVKERAGGEDVQGYIQKMKNQPVALTKEETDNLHDEANKLYKAYIADGTPESVARDLADAKVDKKAQSLLETKRAQAQEVQGRQRQQFERILRENPELMKNGQPNIPQEVLDGMAEYQRSGLADNPYAAYKLYSSDNSVSKLSKEIESLKATISAKDGNAANSAATTGSATSSGPAAESENYTKAQYEALPETMRDKLIASGKIFQIMKKWK